MPSPRGVTNVCCVSGPSQPSSKPSRDCSPSISRTSCPAPTVRIIKPLIVAPSSRILLRTALTWSFNSVKPHSADGMTVVFVGTPLLHVNDSPVLALYHRTV